MLRHLKTLIVPLRAEAQRNSDAFLYMPARGTTCMHPVLYDTAYYSNKVGQRLFKMSKEAWISRFGSCNTLPTSARNRGAFCPRFESSFQLDTQTALAFAKHFLPRIAEANDFVSPSTERALGLTVYEVLKTFGKISKGILLEATSVEEALDHDMALPPAFTLSVEEELRDLGWGEDVEFVVRSQETDKILFVVEVKKTLTEYKALWQMLSELAIAAKHNEGTAFGALTDADKWVFFNVDWQTESFHIWMSDQQRLYIDPVDVGKSTIKALEFMCQALVPVKSSFVDIDVSQSLANVNAQSYQLVQEAFAKYLGSDQGQLLEKLAQKDEIIAKLKLELSKRACLT